MRDATVLVTGAGAPGAPGIIKSLHLVKERKIRIIGVDMSPNSIGFSLIDKSYLIPPALDKEFIPSILRICEEEKVEVLMPLVTRELMPLAENLEKFTEIGVRVSISPPQGLRITNNKYLLMNHCSRNNIKVPVPEFIPANSYEEFKEAVFKLGYPRVNVCFKPPVSNGLRGFRILTQEIDRLDLLINQKPMNTVTTLEDIEPVLKNAKVFPELVVMEYLPGKEYSVDILADNGKALTVIPRLREKIKMGISFVGTTIENKTIIEASKKVVATLKLNGNIGLQFKKDENGIPKLIESNPRLQGTIVLCTAAGVNLVYLALKLALREKVMPPEVKWGVKMIRYWDEVYYDERGQAYTL
ncbi:ATP-grasp domain-containing protein [candidate division WOR-3 bacterium]|nr:ATP-grasp domain-containing protein [candidate division WOR-3 bacterium]